MRKSAFSITACAALSALMLVPAQADARGGSHDAVSSDRSNYFFFGSNTGNKRPELGATKCWKFQAAFGKPAFMQLYFFGNRQSHSLVSGTVIRADAVGSKPDRVIQISGSMSRHAFVGDNDTEIDRYLMNLTYSLAPTGTNADVHFDDLGFYLRGHYHIRLDPNTLDGIFAGNDVIMRWENPLTGPAFQYAADTTVTGARGVTANYMGGINCEGGECGTILPLNNTGSLELVGSNRRQCQRARNNFPL